MIHVVLLGDSIFDNASYVGSGPDVIRQLREALPAPSQATLRAIDGDTTRDVAAQLAQLPPDATHLVVSVGGNDALGQASVLMQSATSVAEALLKLSDVAVSFERDYTQMLQAVLAHNLPTAICTIYNPRFSEPMQQKVAVAALCLFNDCIIRAAINAQIPIVDLRAICSAYADYANDIEPSSQGGQKIASTLAALVAQHDFSQRRAQIFADVSS